MEWIYGAVSGACVMGIIRLWMQHPQRKRCGDSIFAEHEQSELVRTVRCAISLPLSIMPRRWCS